MSDQRNKRLQRVKILLEEFIDSNQKSFFYDEIHSLSEKWYMFIENL